MTGDYDAQVRKQLREAQAERDEARSWARHGYEIGQRHCGWADHGVAPAWLTDGWPPHIDSCEHLTALGQAEARIAAATAVVDRFDDYLLRRHAVADLRDALNGPGGRVERDAV